GSRLSDAVLRVWTFVAWRSAIDRTRPAVRPAVGALQGRLCPHGGVDDYVPLGAAGGPGHPRDDAADCRGALRADHQAAGPGHRVAALPRADGPPDRRRPRVSTP